MRNETASVSMPGPRLPVVLREITECLQQDDWCRVSSDDGSRKYYIIGYEAHDAHQAGEAEFNLSEFPIPTRTDRRSEWAVSAQLADNKSGRYLQQARKDLVRAGATPAAIDRFLEGGMEDWSVLKLRSDLSAEEKSTLRSNFFQAVRLNALDGQVIDFDRQEKADAAIAREKICLGQLAKKYEEIVDRWEPLEVLPFDDPQLQEATKVFLYGFYRACIVLSGSAVETALKDRLPSERGDFEDLINAAARQRLIDPALTTFAHGLRKFRNKVIHEQVEPTRKEADEWFVKARSIVKALRGA